MVAKTPNAALALECQVFRAPYRLSRGPAVSPIEYRMMLDVKNIGAATVTFDELVAALIPQRGTPLVMTTRKGEQTDGAIDDDPAHNWVLQPGEKHRQEYSTNGYTFSLLHDAGDKPLELQVRFLRKGKDVVGRFVSTLPDIQTLPACEDTFGLASAKDGAELRFVVMNG